MMKKLFALILICLFFANFAFSQYLSYDGVNILFGNDSKISVFSCGTQKCYPGFANIDLNNTQLKLSAIPLSDDFVNISAKFDFVSANNCILRFVSQTPLQGAPSEDSSVVLFFNDMVSFAIISTNPDATPFFLDIDSGQVCVGSDENSGELNFILASPLWVNSNLELVKVGNTTEKQNDSDNKTISVPSSPTEVPKQDAGGDSIRPEYIAAASVLIFLIAVLYVIFFRGKKKPEDLSPIVEKSDKTSKLAVDAVDDKKVSEAQKVLDEMLED